jgi:hybrid cluster-associated redox disulfide protein
LITKNTPIIEILRTHPQAREVFSRHGMGCIGCMGSATETLENGARMHDIDVEALIRELSELKQGK